MIMSSQSSAATLIPGAGLKVEINSNTSYYTSSEETYIERTHKSPSGLRLNAASPKNRSGTPSLPELASLRSLSNSVSTAEIINIPIIKEKDDDTSEITESITPNYEGMNSSEDELVASTTAAIASGLKDWPHENASHTSNHSGPNTGILYTIEIKTKSSSLDDTRSTTTSASMSPRQRKATPIYITGSGSGRSDGSSADPTIIALNTHAACAKSPKPKPKPKHFDSHGVATNKQVPNVENERGLLPKSNATERQSSVTKFLSALLGWSSSSRGSSWKVQPASDRSRYEDPPSTSSISAHRVSLRQYETVVEDKEVQFTSEFPPEVTPQMPETRTSDA